MIIELCSLGALHPDYLVASNGLGVVSMTGAMPASRTVSDLPPPSAVGAEELLGGADEPMVDAAAFGDAA